MRLAILISLSCALISTTALGQSSARVQQDRDAIEALPQGNVDLASQWEKSERSTTFYRQADAQTRSSTPDVYPYPATTRPRPGQQAASWINQSVDRTRGTFQNHLTAGTNTATGNLRGAYGYQNDRRFANQFNIAESTTLKSGTSRMAQTPRGDRYASAQPQWGTPSKTYRQTAYQYARPNGLVYRTAQNCNCSPGYVPVAAPAVGYAPQAANQTPAIGTGTGAPSIQLPQTFNQPALPTGQVNCVPGYQFQPAARFGPSSAAWWTPLISRTQKPGTYLGQGIIGQPTAYVDGEPFRNFFRYIAP